MSEPRTLAVLERIRAPQGNALRLSLRGAFARAYAPPPKMPLSQWADKFRVLSPEAAAQPGRWRTSNEPMAKGVMDAVTNPLVEKVTVQAAAQVLKALDCDTPIPTPSGWTAMGDIAVGDAVFDERGQVANVVGVSEIKVGHTCYRFRFSDGAEVVCDAGHLWTVDDYSSRDNKPQRKTIRAFEIADSVNLRGARKRYSVPMVEPIDLPDSSLPIDPYILGVWLGDGHSYSTNITVHENDYEIIRNCEARGARAELVARTPTDVLTVKLQIGRDGDTCNRGHDKCITGRRAKGATEICRECERQASLWSMYGRTPRDPLVPELQWLGERISSLGLKKPRGEKRIPPEYLRASRAQRLELLRGLMDTDGTCAANGRSAFTTSSDAMAAGFAELLGTLGLKARAARVRSRDQRGNGQDSWHFSFIAYSDLPIFALARKLARQPARAGRRTGEVANRRIVSVEQVASRPVRCIAVDSPSHLYLAGRDFVPTHNTEFVLNAIGYYAHGEPGPMLVVYPTLEGAEMFSKERLAPMIRDTPVLRKVFKSEKSRSADSTIRQKSFIGGRLSMVGANAPAGLASRPIRFVLCDEVDRFPASAGGEGKKSEGDPIGLAEERTASFPNRKIVLVSTPTTKGLSRIEDSFGEGDQRRFHVPCPHCGLRQVIEWSGVKFTKGADGKYDPKTAHYVCRAEAVDLETGQVGCGKPWTEAQRADAIDAASKLPDMGWIATKPFKGHASFHASQLSSKRIPLSDIVKKFLDAGKSVEKIKKWMNLSLAETFEEGGEKADPETLKGRREPYDAEKLLPAEVGLITAGVDIQRNRWECETLGWGADEESWSLTYKVHYSDPSTPEYWQSLHEHLSRTFKHPTGLILSIETACVDSGDNTQRVYDFCRDRFSRRIFAIKGPSSSVGKPIWPKKATRNAGKKIDVFLIGLDNAKKDMQDRLLLKAPAPGYCHFPLNDNYGDDYFFGLTIEKSVTKYKYGIPYREWWCPDGARNEPWDCRIYAYAALKSLAVNVSARLAQLRAHVEQRASSPSPMGDPVIAQRSRRVRSSGVSA